MSTMNGSIHDYHRINSKWYLKKYYSKPFEPTASMTLKLSEFLQNRNQMGRRLLDFGTGASVYSVITAAKYYDYITITYYTNSDGEEAKKWVLGDEDCFDWSAWIRMVLEQENPKEPIAEKDIQDREALLRSKIRNVLRCDIRNDNILESEENGGLYDAIISCKCIEVCFSDYAGYCKAAKKLTSLLAKGGILCLMGDIQCSFYKVAGQTFPVLKLTSEQIETAFENAGMTDFNWFINEKPSYADPKSYDLQGFFLMTAIKK